MDSSSELPRQPFFPEESVFDFYSRSLTKFLKQYGTNYELLILLGGFLLGFLVALLFFRINTVQKAKVEEINQLFQGLQGEYEESQKELVELEKWRYRIKIGEKFFYVFLCILLICLYRSQTLIDYLIVKIPHVSLPAASLAIILFAWSGSYFDRLTLDLKQKTKRIKDKLKDTKRLLLHHMDPLVVETLKEIVKNDMKDELFRLRNSDDGCSQKCKKVLEKFQLDLDRNERVVRVMIGFKWCDLCMLPLNKKEKDQPSCKHHCGRRFMAECLPSIKNFKVNEGRIEQLKQTIAELDEEAKNFAEYKRLKERMELMERERKVHRVLEDQRSPILKRLESDNMQPTQ